MHVVAINAEGKGGDVSGIRALIHIVSCIEPQWDLIFLSEFDFLSSSNVSFDIGVHRLFRHWPGEGSRAMSWIVNRRINHLVRSISWDGRCGMLLLDSSVNAMGSSLCLLGLHGAHGDDLSDSFLSASKLLSLRPRCCKTLIVGDWNVDLSPTLSSDPWAHRPSRLEHHFERRVMLDSWLEAVRLSVHMPESVIGSPTLE